MPAANVPSHNVVVDWNADGFFCKDAARTDGLNLIPTPLTWDDVDVHAQDGATVTKVAENTDYGQTKMRVVTSASGESGGQFGAAGGTVDDIPVSALTTYTVSLWAKGISGYAGVSMQIRTFDQALTLITNTTIGALAADWTRYDVTFTTLAAQTFLMVSLKKTNSADLMTYDATGFMLVAGSTAPAGFNTGVTSDLYENITQDVMAMRWHLGMRAAYQLMSDESRFEATLKSPTKLYSPEHAGGALFGKLLPLRKIRVMESGRDLYAGYIERYAPTPGQYRGPFTCQIEAVNAKRFMGDALYLPIQLDKRADQILTTIFDDYVQIPASVDPTDLYNFDSGLGPGASATYDYVGDNWDKGISAWDATKSIVEAERGRFFFGRSGKANFYNRQRFELDVTLDDTFDDTMADLVYTHGSDLVNEVHINTYRRNVGASANSTLWELDSPLTLAGGESEAIRARFASASGQQVGGTDLVTPTSGAGTFVVSSGAATLSAFASEAQGATFTVTNDSPAADVTISTIIVKGRRLTSWNATQVTRRNQPSITAYGLRLLTLDAKLIDNIPFGRDVGAYIVKQRKDPRGVVSALIVKNRDATMLNKQLTRLIGDRIRVKETQTAHDKEYYIIGEGHDWSEAGTVYAVTWALEPAALFDGWLLGEVGRSELGETTYLGL